MRLSRLAPFVCLAPLAAQTPLSGFVYDGHGGPLLAGVVYHCTGNLNVPAGQTLTVERGAIVKFVSAPLAPAACVVSGTLLVGSGGVPGTRAVFTSIDDDSAGGDTNGNGAASAPAPGDWMRVSLGASALASVLEHLEVRYAGVGQVASVTVGAAITLRDVVVRDGLGDGLAVSIYLPIVDACEFRNCRNATDVVSLEAVPFFTGCTASGNLLCDSLRVASTLTNGTAVTVGPANLFQDHVLLWDSANGLDVDATSSLTVLPGTVWKTRQPVQHNVSGSLQAIGNAAGPVVFTSWHDDSQGGDTDKNGPSAGSAGDWRGFAFSPSAGASRIEVARIAFAGLAAAGSIETRAPITLRAVTIDHGGGPALHLRNVATPTVRDCTFADNAGIAIANAPWEALPNLLDNVAVGNAQGDYCRITQHCSGSVDVWPWNYPGSALVVTNVHVQAGAVLRLHEGVVVKFDQYMQSPTLGTFDCDGSGDRPVVLTSIDDDTIAGDTNKDGPPGPGGPMHSDYFSAQPGSAVRWHHTRFRYTGGLHLAGPGYDVYGVRSELSSSHGFVLSYPGTLTQCVAWQNAGDGFQVGSVPGQQLVHCTSVGNGQAGFRRATVASGVMNSVAFGNAFDFLNYVAADVICSCGANVPALGVGNVVGDPVLVAPALGDLRLAAGSPAIDQGFGNPGPPLPLVDIDENSRWLDGGVGFATPDMGAHERARWQLDMTGVLRPSHTITLQCNGPAGDALLLVGYDSWGMLVQPFGMAGILPLWPVLGLLSVGPTGPAGAFTLVLPPALPPGLPFFFQSVASTDFFATGQFTNRCRRVTQPN